MRFILRGKAYELTREEVEKKLLKLRPGPIQKYYVVVNGKQYPPKQVISECIGIALVEFTTMDAANKLYERLGFHQIDAYYHNPLPRVVYYELDL